jgi:glycerophosphoryl diester phosphodiesterase
MTKIIAHRGYLVNGYPGNTLRAFKAGIDHGADGFEFDIHLTSDHRFVCYHDDTLHKLGRNDTLKDLSTESLTSIQLAEGINIPSLEEVFERFGNKCLLNVEMKFKKKGASDLVKLINQFDLIKTPDKLILSSFHHFPLKEVKELDPDIPTGLLCSFARRQLDIAKNLKCIAIHPFYDRVPQDHVILSKWFSNHLIKRYSHYIFKHAREFGILANPWTVNKEEYLRKAILMNVNGIITDKVDLAVKINRDHNQK